MFDETVRQAAQMARDQDVKRVFDSASKEGMGIDVIARLLAMEARRL